MPKKSGPNKTDFVRSLPPDLPIAEVVAKAKEAGISISPNYVSNIRSVAKKGSAKVKKSAAVKPAPAAAPGAPAVAKEPSAPNKSDFVRSQPSTLSAAEVVAKGAEAGLKFSPALVYVIRSKEKRQAKGSKAKKSASAAAAPAAAKAASKSAANGKPTASEFIRSLPVDLPANEVMARGLAEGISFSRALVFMVRSKLPGAKKAAKVGRPKGSVAANGAKKAAPVSASKAVTSDGSSRQEFRKLMLEIGLEQAEALYAEVHGALRALANGA